MILWKKVGEHEGTSFYTIGQRRQLGLGGPGQRWFVIKKDVKKNILLISQNEKDLLYKGDINLDSVNWVSSAKTKIKCSIRFRHGGKLIPGEKKTPVYKKGPFKLKYTDGQEIIHDNNFEFKVVR